MCWQHHNENCDASFVFSLILVVLHVLIRIYISFNSFDGVLYGDASA